MTSHQLMSEEFKKNIRDLHDLRRKISHMPSPSPADEALIRSHIETLVKTTQALSIVLDEVLLKPPKREKDFVSTFSFSQCALGSD